MTIETITGGLRAAAQLEEGTLQHWDELSRDQIKDTSLRSMWFYVADFPLYTARGGKPIFALARHTKEHLNNLVLVHLFDETNSSYEQLIRTGNFRPNPDEAQAVLEVADTLKMEMSSLRLSGDNSVYRFLRVRTKDGFVEVGGVGYRRPNEVEQALIQRVGYTEEFLEVLGSKPHKVSETRVYILNPDYVAAKAEATFVGRASWLDYFDSSCFGADGRGVYIRGALRGVRRVVAPQGRAEKDEVPVAPR